MADESFRVAVRIRPLVQSEEDRGCRVVLAIPVQNQVQISNTDKSFTFDHVFDSAVDQETVYESAVQDIVQKIFQGYNVTILAYGQTGSGKTHTMGTSYSGPDTTGIIPRAVQQIFGTIHTNSDWSYRVTVSFMELYNEQLYDLLSDKARKDCVVDIREDKQGIKIVGITEIEVSEARNALELLAQGSNGRATGSTAMNESSSRSHAIFTISIRQEKHNDPSSATTAKFHLVDLAGSERSKKTGATGDRFKEGVNINKGLFALGNVISQLSESTGNGHVAYRDSKLTRLLQDSLGGNSMTLLIACVSPADYNLEETSSTLRYADRAKKIKNKPVINQDPKLMKILELNSIIKDLRLAVQNQGNMFSCPPQHTELEEKNRSLQKKLRQLTDKFYSNVHDTMYINERAELAEKANEELHTGLKKILDDLEAILKRQDFQLDEHRNELEKIFCNISELLKVRKQREVELGYHVDNKLHHETQPVQTSLNGSQTTSTSEHSFEGDSSDFDEENAEHTLRQAERNTEIQTINRALALKEDLVSKLLENESQIEDHNKEMQEMEALLKSLQAEKEQLTKALENVQTNSASVKLSEIRRRKVQELEKKISELTRKCTEQNRIIKNKEKSDAQVKNLMMEIQSMKSTRVKLVRQMRMEADKFSRWKLDREREVYKLKDQDRKRQNQIIRLQTQHNKQQNVLKRKMEEAWAINKRLKESLEMRQKAKQRREKTISSEESIQTWVAEELDTLLSTVDAECSLEVLQKDCALLSNEIRELEAECARNPSVQLQEKIKDLGDYLNVRNLQIADLQQKIVESDQENRASTRWQPLQSPKDSIIALKYTFAVSSQIQRKYNKKCLEYDELMEKYDQALTQKRGLELKELTRLEKEKIDYAALERPALKVSTDNLKPTLSKKPQKRSVEFLQTVAFDRSILGSDDSWLEEDDPRKDPDYRNTPMHKRLRSANHSKDSSQEFISHSRKQSSEDGIKCACKTTCITRLCSCRKHNVICGPACRCGSGPESCANNDKENMSTKFFSDSEVPKRELI